MHGDIFILYICSTTQQYITRHEKIKLICLLLNRSESSASEVMSDLETQLEKTKIDDNKHNRQFARNSGYRGSKCHFIKC